MSDLNGRGRRIRIPCVEEHNASYSRFVKVTGKELQGRPVNVYRWLLDLGFERKWLDEDSFDGLIMFGIKRGYISRAKILTLPVRYVALDMDIKKEEVRKNELAL